MECCRAQRKSATAREAARGKQSGRRLEIQRLIGRSLRAITDQEALGERTVYLDCDADSGQTADAHGLNHRRICSAGAAMDGWLPAGF